MAFWTSMERSVCADHHLIHLCVCENDAQRVASDRRTTIRLESDF